MIVLSNIGMLYDGGGSSADNLHRDVDLWIDGGRIQAIRPHGSGEVPGPDHATVADGLESYARLLSETGPAADAENLVARVRGIRARLAAGNRPLNR